MKNISVAVPVPNQPTVNSVGFVDTSPANSFRKLMSIDVSRHIERKGQFGYLSWPYAVAQLRQADPEASWEIRRFDGLPYLATELGYFVEVAVTVQGVTLSQIHPVLDGRNRPIAVPTSFDINTSIQRCLVKAIALHGLGLSIYAGEDLTQISDMESDPTKPTKIAEPGTSSGAAPERLTLPQLRYIERLIEETGTNIDRLLEYVGAAALDEIPRSEASRVIQALQGKRRAA